MRLMQAMAGAPLGGAEAFFMRLALALQRRGVTQHLLLRPDAARRAALQAGGVAFGETAFGGPFDLLSRWRFAREVGRFRPSHVLTWMSRATAACPKGDFVHVARLGGYYDLKYYRGAQHLIGNTEDIVGHLVRQGWPGPRAHYLPNFVDESFAEPIAKRALDTPEDAIVLLALGRLHPNKAFDVLLHALARLPRVHLWLAGDGPLRGELMALARRLELGGRVHFLGWWRDPAPLYASADLVVCCSRIEPLGNVVIEAWARGKPVIAAAAVGPAGLIRHGETGLLVPIDDESRLAAAIAELLASPALAGQLAAGGRAAYEGSFTEAKVVDAYLDLLARLTN